MIIGRARVCNYHEHMFPNFEIEFKNPMFLVLWPQVYSQNQLDGMPLCQPTYSKTPSSTLAGQQNLATMME